MSIRRASSLVAVLLLLPLVAPFIGTAGAASIGNGTPSYTVYPGPAAAGNGAAEPSIGVNWNTGNVFFQDYTVTWRLVFDDTQNPPTAVWQNVKPPNSIYNVDPMAATDPVTGRTFAGGLDGACSIMSYTDNDGQSWTPMANACAGASVDHQTIGSGPWRDGVTPAGATYSRAVYYCAQTSIVSCATSYNGGLTFNAPTPVPCGYANPGLHGSVHVGPQGHAYLPFKRCAAAPGGAAPGFSVSADNGLTWTGRPVPGALSPSAGFDPDVATTPSGWTYMAWAGANWEPMVGLTKDHGATWTRIVNVAQLSGSNVKGITFPEMVAGDDERAAIVYLGTTTAGNPHVSTFTGTWDLYVSTTFDAGLTWTTVKVTSDPVQRGWICASGTTCSAGRNLLDFIDAQVDKQGRVVVAFADGCVGSCAQPGGSAASSTSDWATVARQSGGRTLFAAYDTATSPLAAIAGGPYTGVAGSPTALAGGASGGTAPYTYSWSVTSAPSGSAAGAASFSNVNSPTPTFTPDKPGTYGIALSVQDSLGAVATSSATLLASPSTSGTCGTGGVIVADDADDDGGSAGSASEVRCLRAADDASTFNVFIDLAGTDLTLSAAQKPLYYDVFLTAPWAANVTFLIEVIYDGATLEAGFYDPETYLPIPGKTATARFDGNTLNISVARSEILNPPNGASVAGLHVDINHCTVATTCGLAHVDYAPDTRDGTYTFGSSGTSGGGVPLPLCSVELADDPDTDTTATVGKGIRELTRFGASDNDATWTFCFDVADFNDRPTGAAATDRTRFVAFWTADYEGALIAYSTRVVVNTDGSLGPASFLKGAGGVSSGSLGGSAMAERSGNQIRIILDKSTIGAPADAEIASAVSARVQDDNGNTATTFDSTASNVYTFGRKLQDTTAPSAVTGLTVVDGGTGSTLNLAWSAASDDTGVVSYMVKRSGVAGGPYTTVGTPAGTSFTDSGLSTGSTYYYVVAARDAAGNVGPDSAEAGAEVLPLEPDHTPPGAPTGLGTSGTTATEIHLTWSPATDAESGISLYRIWRDGVVVGSTSATSWNDAGLAPETSYTYAVSAVNGAGLEGPLSAALVASTLPLPPPDCGQVAFELVTDADGDSSGGDRGSDLVRVSVRETADRIWFHLGTRNLSDLAAARSYRTSLTNGDQGYVVIASYDGNRAMPFGVYTQVVVDGVGSAGPRTSQDVLVQRLCETLAVGVRRADIGSPAVGTQLRAIYFEAASNTTSSPVIYDRAPNAGAVSFTVGSSNFAPVLDPIGDKAVGEAGTLTFAISATDLNGDALSYSASNLPSGARFDAQNATFTWTPGYDQAGTYAGVRFEVTDGLLTDFEEITIVVDEVNALPELAPIGDRTVVEGRTLSFTLSTTDADGDALTYSASNLPPGATFDTATGAFSFTPVREAGHAVITYSGVRFEVSDGEATDAEEITIVVEDDNFAPVLAAIGNKAVDEGQTLTFTLAATDADGDNLTYSATNLPAGATFDAATATFTWATQIGDAGTYSGIRFQVADAEDADHEEIAISVGDVDVPPTLEPIGDKTVAEAQTLTFTVSASDPDSATLTYSATGLPSGASFSPSTRTFTWTPTYTQAGAYAVRFEVTDGTTTVGETISIAVANTDRAPTLVKPAAKVVYETKPLSVLLSANDADGDAITFSVTPLPAGASVAPAGPGKAYFNWTPSPGQAGIYRLTIGATANGATTTQPLNVTVKFLTGLTLTAAAATLEASPGETVTVTATLRNTGPQTDTFVVTSSNSARWTQTNATQNVTLGPGQTATLTFEVTVPANGAGTSVSIGAVSTGDAMVKADVKTAVEIPLVVVATMAMQNHAFWDTPTVTVTVKHLDGTPAAGALVRVTQTPEQGAVFATTGTGTADATGTFTYKWDDARARMPGVHTVVAAAQKAGGVVRTAQTSYNASV